MVYTMGEVAMTEKKSSCKKPKAKRKLNGRLFKKGNKVGRLGKGVPHPNQPRTIADVQQAFIRSTHDIDDRLEQLKRDDNGMYLRIIAGLTVKLQEQAAPQRIEISFGPDRTEVEEPPG